MSELDEATLERIRAEERARLQIRAEEEEKLRLQVAQAAQASAHQEAEVNAINLSKTDASQAINSTTDAAMNQVVTSQEVPFTPTPQDVPNSVASPVPGEMANGSASKVRQNWFIIALAAFTAHFIAFWVISWLGNSFHLEGNLWYLRIGDGLLGGATVWGGAGVAKEPRHSVAVTVGIATIILAFVLDVLIGDVSFWLSIVEAFFVALGVGAAIEMFEEPDRKSPISST